MDVLASEIDKEPPGVMLFADDLVLCETSKAAVKRELDIWRNQFERHGLRVSRTKTAHMLCNDYDNDSRNYEEIQLGDDKLNTVTTLNYLGSIFDSNGGAECPNFSIMMSICAVQFYIIYFKCFCANHGIPQILLKL